MMRDDALNSHVDPVRTEMTSMQQILISHVCDSYKSESKGIIAYKISSQVCYERNYVSIKGINVHHKNNSRTVLMIMTKIYMHLWHKCLVMTKDLE